MKTLILPVIALLGACASTSGVIQAGPDSFIVHRMSKAPGATLIEVKADAYREAGAYCSSKGKTVNVVSTNETPPGLMRFPEAEVKFSCV